MKSYEFKPSVQAREGNGRKKPRKEQKEEAGFWGDRAVHALQIEDGALRRATTALRSRHEESEYDRQREEEVKTRARWDKLKKAMKITTVLAALCVGTGVAADTAALEGFRYYADRDPGLSQPVFTAILRPDVWKDPGELLFD